MKTINDISFAGKKALIRVDFNVPQDENKKVTDNTRIVAAKPTIDKILNDGGSVIIMTHLGRPKGKVNPDFSLSQIVDEVSKVLGKEVKFASDCIGEVAEKALNDGGTPQLPLPHPQPLPCIKDCDDIEFKGL